MAAKKKATKKTAPKKAPGPRAARAPSVDEETIRKLEARIAALEARAHGGGDEVAREVRELRLALVPTLETYRNNVRARLPLGMQMPWVLGGTIVIILILAGVLASSGAISGDAAVILITASLGYAIAKLRNYLLE